MEIHPCARWQFPPAEMRVDVTGGDVLRKQLDSRAGVALRVVAREYDRLGAKMFNCPTQVSELRSRDGKANWRASCQRGLKLHRALRLDSIIFHHVTDDARLEVGELHAVPCATPSVQFAHEDSSLLDRVRAFTLSG